MTTTIVIVIALTFYYFAYKFYSKYLEKLLGVDENSKTPAYTKYDGVDFVPAKNWFILLGHHFSSIAGAGPIIGATIAVAYWGWLPAFLWILLGAIFIGAVSDYSSMVVSVKNSGNSISHISGSVVSLTAKKFFSIFIFFSVILVIAVFTVLAAKTFVSEPSIVLPSIGIIPVAIVSGYLMYKKNYSFIAVSVFSIFLLVALTYLGSYAKIKLPENVWILILLIYAYFASVLPVQYLLQPRDYIAGYLLYLTLFIGVIGAIVSIKPVNAPLIVHSNLEPTKLIFPMLFITVACGAISGFHSLVSSGTTSKQLANEKDARKVGYLGMLLESMVGVLVICATGFALTRLEHLDLVNKSPIIAFATGFGRLTEFIFKNYGFSFAILALNAFIITTLDTATRIGRYSLHEISNLGNKFLVTFIVIVLAGIVAYFGYWQRIWPLFGASNQLIGALALLTVSMWLRLSNKPIYATLLPSIFMIIITTTAFIIQLLHYLKYKKS
ncbi:MAG: carbon starvation protein A, partial [bacterium]|nr:carbon starvation protein A [bacterium]